jgi:thioredoxin 1
MRLPRLPTLPFLALAALAGAPAVAAAATPGASHTPAAALPRLVFFMNPNGAPCQMQDRILRDMAAELRPRVEVVYYRTTEGSEIARFQQYGIRSLPALVLTDAAGRELRRATPGIQSAEQVRLLLGR